MKHIKRHHVAYGMLATLACAGGEITLFTLGLTWAAWPFAGTVLGAAVMWAGYEWRAFLHAAGGRKHPYGPVTRWRTRRKFRRIYNRELAAVFTLAEREETP